jgi:hypothetical protein
MQPGHYSFDGDPAAIPPPAQTPDGPAQPCLSSDGRVFVLPIRLEPGKTYSLWVNNLFRPGFRSIEGRFPDPVHVTFATAAALERNSQ